MKDRLPSISLHTLILLGEEDASAFLQLLGKIHQLIEVSEQEVMIDANHNLIILKQFQELIETVEGFFKNL